jgi:hypothetical protein
MALLAVLKATNTILILFEEETSEHRGGQTQAERKEEEEEKKKEEKEIAENAEISSVFDKLTRHLFMMYCRGSNWRLLSAVGEGDGPADTAAGRADPMRGEVLFDPERFIAEITADLIDLPHHHSSHSGLVLSTQRILSLCRQDKGPSPSPSRLSSPFPAMMHPDRDWSFMAFNSASSLFKHSHQAIIAVILIFILALGKDLNSQKECATSTAAAAGAAAAAAGRDRNIYRMFLMKWSECASNKSFSGLSLSLVYCLLSIVYCLFNDRLI